MDENVAPFVVNEDGGEEGREGSLVYNGEGGREGRGGHGHGQEESREGTGQ